jgi:5-formyltetrahydrofolate cyclo-ligase
MTAFVTSVMYATVIATPDQTGRVAPPEDPIAAAKARIRAATISARARRTPADLVRAGSAIAQHGVDRWRGARLVAAYLSLPTEPPTAELLAVLATGGTRIVVPVVTGDALGWADYSPGDETVVGPGGVREPAGPRLGADVLAAADVVLVPALAVDANGHRLGRGRGYYDRALAQVSVPSVAVVFDEELIEEVPVEAHDRPVQGVLRPAGYAWF